MGGEVTETNAIPVTLGALAAQVAALIAGDSGFYVQKSLNGSDFANVATVRTNLGLGTLATQDASAVAITGGTGAFSTLGATGLTTLGNGSANYVTVAGAAGGSAPAITALGSDAIVNVDVVPKSTGIVRTPRFMISDNFATHTPAVPVGAQFYMNSQQTGGGGALQPKIRVGASLFGVSNVANNFLYTFNIDTDRIDSPLGLIGMRMGHSWGGGTGATGARGGRTAFQGDLTMSGDAPNMSGSGSFHVAVGAFSRADYWAGGIPGDERGSLFGENSSARAKSAGTIGSRGFRGATGHEADTGVQFDVLGKSGYTAVEWFDSVGRGVLCEYGYSVAKQPGGTAPGFDFGYAVGSPFGWWGVRPTGTVFGAYALTGANYLGTPDSVSAAMGIDLLYVPFSHSALRFDGFAVDGSGNVGGQTVGGVALKTRGAITAETAVVASIAVVKGGQFHTKPTLTLSAPPGSGTTATATVATMKVDRIRDIVGTQGTGYTVGDVLTFSGGTFTAAATLTVDAVHPDGTGKIIALSVTNAGNYSVLPSSPVTLTGGTGTGAQASPAWAILTVSVTGAGSNYPSYPHPKITYSGGTMLYEPLLAFTMTATQAALNLNPGGSVTIGSGNGSANYLTVAGAAGSAHPVISAAGSDADIDVKLLSKGLGFASAPRLFVGDESLYRAAAASSGSGVYMRVNRTQSGAGGAKYRFGGNISGSLSASLTSASVAMVVDSDTVAAGASRGLTGVYIGHAVDAGATGGRTALSANLIYNAEVLADEKQFQVAMGGFATSGYSAGGVVSQPRGNLFGANFAAVLKQGAGARWQSLCASELDVMTGQDVGVLWRVGQKVVSWGSAALGGSKTRGITMDAAHLIGAIANLNEVAWRVGYGLGGVEGWWPFDQTSRIMGTYLPIIPGGPAIEAGDGIALHDITFYGSAFRSPNFQVDRNGNIAGKVTSGLSLQTNSAIVAKSGGVSGIAILDPGLYAHGSVAPSVTISAPLSGGATATATISSMKASWVAGFPTNGTGYAVNDVVALVGGTGTAATIRIVAVDGTGQITEAKIESQGNYSALPANPAALAAGTATVSLWWEPAAFTVTSPGDGYGEFERPTVTIIMPDGSSQRLGMFRADITAAQVPLVLNSGAATKVDSLTVGSNQVVAARQTGWTAPTGTLSRGTFDQSTVTLPQLAQRVAALITDLTTHGLVGA